MDSPRALGASGISVSPIGIGTNRWGAPGVPTDQVLEAYRAARTAGLDFIDTAEVYNRGHSEEVVGRALREDARGVIVASKFLPLPHRVTTAQFMNALDGTLRRLGRDSIDLYYLHFPYSLVGIRTWMERMALAVRAGKIRAVGISNCNVARMRAAADALERQGVPLAANQVHYSLAHRDPETNGVLDACRSMNVALVAYRPLAGGKLSGETAGLIGEIARKHGKTPSQVALRWLLQRDEHVIVIPGATKVGHARDNAEASTFELAKDELEAITTAGSRSSAGSSTG